MGRPSTDRHKCKVVSQEDVQIRVHRVSYENHLFTETVLTVKNHTACELGCMKNESTCNGYQTWNDFTCRCDCKVQKDAAAPICKKDQEWGGSDRCNCICRYDLVDGCVEPNVFDTNTCTCMHFSDSAISCASSSSKRMGTGNVVLVVVIVMLILVICCIAMIWFRRYRTRTPEVKYETNGENHALNNGNDEKDKVSI